MSEIAVIGGGASGLAAAICAARLGSHVTVYEKNDRVGKKLLATGNGKCNLTHLGAAVENYHGENVSFIQPTIKRFWVSETLDFFDGLGLLTKADSEGRVYPYCERASAVADVLRLALEENGVSVVCNFEVRSVVRRKAAFEIVSFDGRHVFSDRVIMSAGGMAAPGLGGGKSGYEILKSLGHRSTALRPAIVQIKTDTDPISGLKGVRCCAQVRLNGSAVSGELLFTEYGISGIPAFFLSSYYSGGSEKINIDFFRDYDESALFKMLLNKAQNVKTLENVFTGALHKNIARAIFKQCGENDLNRSCSTLENAEIKKLCHTSKNFELTANGTMSWNNAQVTSGGIKTDDIDPETFMSSICPKLYITGELIDIDGDCGGYNLQWAWSSGCIAGMNAAI